MNDPRRDLEEIQELAEGLLRVRHKWAEMNLHVRDGALVFVTSSLIRHRLGTLLVRELGVPMHVIDELRERERQTGVKPGKLLASGKIIAGPQLRLALRRQYEEVLLDLLVLEDAEREILPNTTLSAKGVIVYRVPIRLLLTGLRPRLDTFARLRGEAGTLDQIPIPLVSEPEAQTLALGQELMAFQAIDGARTLEHILLSSTIPADACLANLLALHRKQLIRIGDHAPALHDTPAAPQRVSPPGPRTPPPTPTPSPVVNTPPTPASAQPARGRGKKVPEATLDKIQSALVKHLGPMAEFALDTALEELGYEWDEVPLERLIDLIDAVAEEVPNPRTRNQFIAQMNKALKLDGP